MLLCSTAASIRTWESGGRCGKNAETGFRYAVIAPQHVRAGPFLVKIRNCRNCPQKVRRPETRARRGVAKGSHRRALAFSERVQRNVKG
jgi:hypothetical protein